MVRWLAPLTWNPAGDNFIKCNSHAAKDTNSWTRSADTFDLVLCRESRKIMSQVESVTHQYVRALEQQRYSFLLENDPESYARLCHPELIFVHATGTVESKESFLGALRSGDVLYERVEHPIHSCVVVENTAVISGEVHAELSVEGVSVTLRNHVVATWIRETAEWSLLSHVGVPLTRP